MNFRRFEFWGCAFQRHLFSIRDFLRNFSTLTIEQSYFISLIVVFCLFDFDGCVSMRRLLV